MIVRRPPPGRQSSRGGRLKADIWRFAERARRDCGLGSLPLAHRQSQTGQIKLALLGVPEVAGVGCYNRGIGPQRRDDLSCLAALVFRIALTPERAER